MSRLKHPLRLGDVRRSETGKTILVVNTKYRDGRFESLCLDKDLNLGTFSEIKNGQELLTECPYICNLYDLLSSIPDKVNSLA